jgi:hypothetical protein
MEDMNSYADSIRRRTWHSLATSPEWSAWLGDHVDLDSMDSFVYFEARERSRLVVRGDTLSYYVPMTYVQAAYEMRTLPSFMGEIFRDIWLKWAGKRGLPDPPPLVPPAR